MDEETDARLKRALDLERMKRIGDLTAWAVAQSGLGPIRLYLREDLILEVMYIGESGSRLVMVPNIKMPEQVEMFPKVQ